MSLYEVIKDAASVAQKADNIELYKILLDVQQQAIEIQQRLYELTKENESLKGILETSDRVVRYEEKTIVTLENDKQNISYCSRCWDKDKKTIQVVKKENGRFSCPECNNSGIYSDEQKCKWESGAYDTSSYRGLSI